jgi:hypothetical protein
MLTASFPSITDITVTVFICQGAILTAQCPATQVAQNKHDTSHIDKDKQNLQHDNQQLMFLDL